PPDARAHGRGAVRLRGPPLRGQVGRLPGARVRRASGLPADEPPPRAARRALPRTRGAARAAARDARRRRDRDPEGRGPALREPARARARGSAARLDRALRRLRPPPRRLRTDPRRAADHAPRTTA